MSANLLVELFTEELPPKALKRLGEAFAGGLVEGLKSSGLLDATSKAKAFATPRRLAVYISSVLPKGYDRPVEQKLMPVAVARKEDGGWSDALRRKLAGMGREQLADAPLNSKVGTDSLAIKPDGKAESVYLRTVAVGQSLEQALSKAIEDTIAKLPIPKVMSYQLADGATTVKFVRPAHGLVAMHGDKVLAVATLGLEAGRVTHGHRFQGATNISLVRADEYEAKLENEGHVIADFDKRRSEVAKQLSEKAQALKSSLGPDADYTPLLDEVTALVEYPTVYIGEFEPGFLSVPQECLILTMRQNQKYFPLFDANGKLTNNFLIVSNMRLANSKNIVEGNQRVVRPRLADARFFFETDKKTKLADRVPQLGNIVYHNKLGSQLDRVERVLALAIVVAQKIGADPALADRAALLAKADLVTNMVGEFPELQGIMGRYYALADGEDPKVADAIEQHYRPRFAGDVLPDDNVAVAVALADKLVTLVGMFAVGQQPTGDKDPLGLRRQTLGIVRILVEKPIKLNLGADLLEPALTAMSQLSTGKLYDELLEFIRDRLRGLLRDQGFLPDEIESIVDHTLYLNEVVPLLNAVKAFKAMPEGKTLAAAHKRIRNILKSATQDGLVEPNLSSMRLDAEKHLFTAMQSIPAHFSIDTAAERLKELAQLGPKVDAFFDGVMVMDQEPSIRANRIALLRKLEGLMNQVADISKLAA
jgi:glycyl-tRNA synthetase beta chain